MKKIILTTLLSVLCAMGGAQSSLIGNPNTETYIETTLTAAQLQKVAQKYSVDKVEKTGDNLFRTRLCIFQREYSEFEATGISYQIVPAAKPTVNMASSYEELVSSWNRYPTYSAYIETMATFQQQFPNLCRIDTVLAQTPDGHAILAAHISNDLSHQGNKPAFWYSSTIHGDEPVGYYMMLHLIHHLLNNYATNQDIRDIVDNIDIWITPLENPDGTYHFSDNSLNESPWSTRANANGVDLNRSYPIVGGMVKTEDCEPEIEAMMAFCTAHKFNMSANFHGGAELVNYPWDSWMSNQRYNPDQNWWEVVSHRFADTCQYYSSNYMTDENDGVTEGGDWYIITGSRQDYFNYYERCREATMEISSSKVVSSNRLSNYWDYIHPSLLNYMRESLRGIRGIVTDSITGAPVEAYVVLNNVDDAISTVTSHLPIGNYHRYVLPGEYSVTYTASGYHSKTATLTVTEGAATVADVRLKPYDYAVQNREDKTVKVFPNPAADQCTLVSEHPLQRIQIIDAHGRHIKRCPAKGNDCQLDLSTLATGTYFLRVETENGTYTRKLEICRD